MARPLANITILDLSWVLSGPFCTMVLADLGARVIKVERPGHGDLARGNGPFIGNESSYFMSINRGKESITLDLGKPRGKEVFLKLVQRADVLVENFVPGTMERLGLGHQTLLRHNPKLIYAAVSGFGQTGPYAQKPALDVIVQAMGGIMSITGEPGGPPIRPGASLGDIVAGLFAAVGILAALREREQSSQGQALDISMMDCQVAILENAFARYFATGEVPKPLGTRHPVFTPFQAFPTKDGYVVVAMVGEQWPLFCATIERLDLIDDPRYETGWSRTQHYEALEPVLNAALKAKTTSEWLDAFSQVGIPTGPINSIDQVARDPQVLHREMFVQVEHPRLGPLKVVNTPLRFSRTPSRPVTPSPDLGEHSHQVLAQLLGLTDAEIRQLAEDQVI